LQQRFESLDLLEAPYQWPEIERRAARPEIARTPSWLHGVWVAAATAAAVLVFAGGVVAGRWLLGAGSLLDAALGAGGPLRPATPEDVSVLALVVAGAGGGTVLLTAALTLLWRWRKSNGQFSTMQTRGEVMETMEKTIDKPERTIETVTRNNRWLILAVVVLLAALVALGAWLLIDNFVTSDVESLILDYNAAWIANDYEALAAVVTDDFVHTGTDGREYQGESELRPEIASYEGLGFEIVTAGPIAVSGDWAMRAERVSFFGGDFEGISLYEIEGNLVKQHMIVGFTAVP
jgi:hypothetical protein